MYILLIVLLMLVFPFASFLAEMFLFRSTVGIVPLAAKWFVFWAMGVRLFTAGLHQAFRPQFTAETILGVKGSEQFMIVQELGFANLSMGLLGICTILNGNWIFPAAMVGCLFIGLAGIRHLFSKGRNLLQNSAMFSNLVEFVILLIYIIWALIH
jgi:hypothetical protein